MNALTQHRHWIVGSLTFGVLTMAVLSALLLIATRLAHAQSGPYGVVSPTVLNFQAVVGQTSPTQRVSLKNTGNSKLIISNISISEYFALPINHCSGGIKPGTRCNVYVTFTPGAVGTESGTLSFTDNASNSPQTVSLTGTGINSSPTETVLYNFTGSPDGAEPVTGLTSDGAGNLYGITSQGGDSFCDINPGYGCGTVFELSPNGSGGWNETVLYSFTGGTDGGFPEGSVIFDSVGNLYGIARAGGDFTCGAPYGCGVVFETQSLGNELDGNRPVQFYQRA